MLPAILAIPAHVKDQSGPISLSLLSHDWGTRPQQLSWGKLEIRAASYVFPRVTSPSDYIMRQLTSYREGVRVECSVKTRGMRYFGQSKLIIYKSIHVIYWKQRCVSGILLENAHQQHLSVCIVTFSGEAAGNICQHCFCCLCQSLASVHISNAIGYLLSLFTLFRSLAYFLSR